MTKRLILFVFLIFTNLLKAQYIPIDTIVIDVQKVCFFANDTTFLLTKYVNEYGDLNFSRGFQDIRKSDSLIRYSFIKDELITTTKNYNYLDKVDTIKSYRSDFVNYMLPSDTVIKGVHYLKDNLVDDVMISSIFKSINITTINNNRQPMLRILEHIDEYSIYYRQLVKNKTLFQSSTGVSSQGSLCYILMEIEFFNDKTVFKRTICVSANRNGIYKLETDSVLMNLNDVKKLKEQFIETRIQSDLNCRFPGNLSLMEYRSSTDYTNFVFSEDCLFYNRDYKAERRVYEAIQNLYYKYFSR